MCVYNEKYFIINYVEKVKDIECDEESEDVSIQSLVVQLA